MQGKQVQGPISPRVARMAVMEKHADGHHCQAVNLVEENTERGKLCTSPISLRRAGKPFMEENADSHHGQTAVGKHALS
eukprot:11469012-Prorocentrum_lima.AAC.1